MPKKGKYFEKFISNEKDIINNINFKDFVNKNKNINQNYFDKKLLEQSLNLYELMKSYGN